jgi:hypothetical protein
MREGLEYINGVPAARLGGPRPEVGGVQIPADAPRNRKQVEVQQEVVVELAPAEAVEQQLELGVVA